MEMCLLYIKALSESEMVDLLFGLHRATELMTSSILARRHLLQELKLDGTLQLPQRSDDAVCGRETFRLAERNQEMLLEP